MSFGSELQKWAEQNIGVRIDAEQVRKLLIGGDIGVIYPLMRNVIAREQLEYRPPTREATQPALIPGSWIYYPVSDDAPYSWGLPYDTTLGTPSAGAQCPIGQLRTIEKDDRPYRLYDEEADQVTHGTLLMAGRYIWKYNDYVISWGPCMGYETLSPQFSDNTTRSIFRNGSILVSTEQSSFNNPWEIRGAAIRHLAGVNYVYIISNGRGTGDYTTADLIQRAVIDPYGQDQEPNWESSPGVTAALDGLTPPFHTTSFDGGTTYLLPCSFNKSCTRVLICQPGRVVELDITTWGSEFVVNDTYFANSFEFQDVILPGRGSTPILSAYIADTDTRRDLTFEIEYSGDPQDNPWQPGFGLNAYGGVIMGYLKEDGVALGSYILYHNLAHTDEFYGRRQYGFLTVNPYFQDPSGRVYCVDFHRARRLEDNWVELGRNPLKRYHQFDVYSSGFLVDSTETVEDYQGDDPLAPDYEKFTVACPSGLRDAFLYPQYNVCCPNLRWLFFWNERTFSWIMGEACGYGFPLPSFENHWISRTMGVVSNNVSYEDPPGNVVNYFFDNQNNFSFASNENGSFVLSRRIFDGWNPPEQDPVYRWWNTGSVDLLLKTGATGANQRLLARGCQSTPDFVKNDWCHVAPYHASADQPFPPG